MALPSIVMKLTHFLQNTVQMGREPDVVYFMVELRKIIDSESLAKDFPAAKFYADWTVHSRKDRITPEMRDVLLEIYEYAKSVIENPAAASPDSPVNHFLYMNTLREEVRRLLGIYGINAELTEEDENWKIFVVTLVKVLEEQPIVGPVDNKVDSLVFEPANDGCSILLLKFVEPVLENHWFKCGNAY